MPHPKFTKSSAEMVARFDELAELAPQATRRQMFGYPSLVLNGNMFMSLFGDSLVLRLDEAGRQDLVESHDGEPFEPMPGRPMREYVVASPDLATGAGIKAWVERSLAYAEQLPPKQPKPRKTAARKPPSRSPVVE